MWGDPSGRTKSLDQKPQPYHDVDEVQFAAKAKRFDEADDAFRKLVDALNAYKAAILHATECGVTVATQMERFFSQRDKEHKPLVAQFMRAQTSMKNKWLGDAQKSFDAEVLAPVKSRLDEVPKVRDYMKQRSAALAELQKRQKKFQNDRQRGGGSEKKITTGGGAKERTRYRDKARKLHEISSRYTMFHDEVIQRFSYIENNMASFVIAPLRSLVTISTDVAACSLESLQEVLKLVSVTPSITKDVPQAAPMASLNEVAGGIVDTETWDDSYAFGDESDRDPDNETEQTDNAEVDNDSTRASGRRPPRGRQRSADSAPRGTSSTYIPGFEAGLAALEASAVTSPRRGRSASSPVPTDGLPLHSPTLSLPLPSTLTGMLQRDTSAPGSLSGRASASTSAHQEAYFLPSVGTSAASSTSADNVSPDAVRGLGSHEMGSYRRRRRDGKGSGDTIGSVESLVKHEVLTRLVALYDFTPSESNELEMRKGDIIDVTRKNDSGWWFGRSRGSVGYFPKNHTRELSEQEELDYLDERRRRRRGHRRQESQESKRSGQTVSHSSLTAM